MPTAHSEYHTLNSVLLCHPETAFRTDIKLNDQWQDLNYLEKPNLETAVNEYQHLLSVFREGNIDMHFLPENSDLTLDALYCRDASIATDFGMILCNMGKYQRKAESEVHRHYFKKMNIPILGEIMAPGTLEGGDVTWIDNQTIAVGHSYRTNWDGIQQLKSILKPNGVEVLVVDLPHFKGPNDVFHLMSVLSPVDKDLAVIYSPLLPIGFRTELLNRGYDFVEVPDDEFASMGCNVLAIAPRVCIVVDGNPITKAGLERNDCRVLSYAGKEISIKGGGGPTCLTRPLSRQSA